MNTSIFRHLAIVAAFMSLYDGGTLPAVAASYHVSASSGADLNTGLSWSDPKKTIQAAIDVASAGDEVWVTNGLYNTGGRPAPGGTLTNRVVMDKALTVRSVNGPSYTTIEGKGPRGNGAVRCVWMTNGATLIGFTLTNGYTDGKGSVDDMGGGVFAYHISTGSNDPPVSISNCVITKCVSDFGGGVAGKLTSGAKVILADSVLFGNYGQVNGGGAYFCTLRNCVVTSNQAWLGGGCYFGSLTGCTLSGNKAENILGGQGGGVYRGTLDHCHLLGNSALREGGGAYYATLRHCTVSGNSAYDGGGVYLGTLSDSTLSGNLAYNQGGGADGASLARCILSSNTAAVAGGSYGGSLSNCSIVGNAAYIGGGSFYGNLYHCLLAGNVASNYGGGLFSGTLRNCTVSGNSAGEYGGGIVSGSLGNSIAYGNHAPSSPNYSNVQFAYSCTIPMPAGPGNMTNDPQLVDVASGNFHLLATSPCRDAGDNAYAAGTADDLDGNPRIVHGYVDLGAYEFQGGTGQADYDEDGMGNGDEQVAGTDLADAAEVFELEDISFNTPATLAFNAVSGRLYAVEFTDNLSLTPQEWTAFTNNIPGGQRVVVTDPAEATNRSYRVQVRLASPP